MSTFTDLEKDAASVDGFVNENGLITTRRNGPKPSYQYLVDGWNAQINAELDRTAGVGRDNAWGTVQDGIDNTGNDDYFSVVSPNDDNYLDLYKNESGVAVFKKSYPSAEVTRGAQYISSARDLEEYDVTPHNCSLSVVDGNFKVTSSNYCWLSFSPEIDTFKTYVEIASRTRFIGFGNYEDGSILALCLGPAASFGKIYRISEDSILRYDSLNVSGATPIENFTNIRITLTEKKLAIERDANANHVYLPWIELELNSSVIPDSYGLSVAFLGSASGVTLLDRAEVIMPEIYLSTRLNDIEQNLTEDKTVVNNTDIEITQGEGLIVKDGILYSNSTQADWPALMFDHDVTEVEFTCTPDFYGLMLGWNYTDNKGVYYVMGKSTTAGGIQEVQGSSFTLNATSISPGTYGLPNQGDVPLGVQEGDVVNAKLLNDRQVKIEIYRQGVRPATFVDTVYISSVMRAGKSSDLTGWNDGMRLGILSLSRTNGTVLATDLKILSRGATYTPSYCRWNDKSYYVLGDSIAGSGSNMGRGWPHYSALKIGAKLNWFTSKSGFTIPQIYAVRNEFQLDADLISIYAGVNDYMFQAPIGSVGTTDPTTTRGALKLLLTYMAENAPQAVLAYVGPSRLWGYDTLGSKEPDDMTNAGESSSVGITPLIDYVNAIKEVCDEFGIAHLDLYHNHNLNQYNMSRYTYDGLHPNYVGDERLGYAIGSFLANIG